MRFVERVAEGLARRLSRRGALKGAAAAIFANAAAIAAVGPGADAARCAVRLVEDTACNLPFLTPCTGTSASYCSGANCSGACLPDTVFYGQERQASCWCTALQPVGTSKNRYGYWKCCDCRCSQPITIDPNSPWSSTQYPDGTCGCGCREHQLVTFKPVGPKKKQGPAPEGQG
ncbi:MAG: hypothetical protein ACR2J8_01975 [Thermomicrobiales bacterium]